jgi:hypothetical protein
VKLPNYIEDTNPFRLPGPPIWFLRQLWDFDSSLVIVPSRQECSYRLTQRRKLRLAENVVNDVLKEQADARMLASYGLIPVTTIKATADWGNPYMFVELHNRAPWRLGGADKVNAMLEAQDKADALAKRAKVDEHLDYLSKDAWKYYNKKVGLRSNLWSPATPTRSPAPAQAPNVRTASKARYRPDVMTTWLDRPRG